MNNKISELVNSIPSSATFAVSLYANKLKAEGKSIINLSVGEPDFITPNYIQDATKKIIDTNKYFSYPPAAGYSELRNAISKKFKSDNNLNYDSNQIVISPGSKQALSLVSMTIVNPGDEVIIFGPYWTSYEATVLISRGIPVVVNGSIQNNYKVTPEDLAKAINSKTKAILFSSPCNPTGVVFSETYLRSIAEVLESWPDVYVISDEIYEYINFGKVKHFSIGSIKSLQDRTITSNGFSKAYAMTGWRLGYIGAPLEVSVGCAKLQGQFSSGTCGIVQMAGLEALNQGKTKIEYMVEEYKKRRDYLDSAFKQIKGFESICPDGAFYMFPDITYYLNKKYENTYVSNASEFCKLLLTKVGVALVPGDAFGTPNCVRLSFASSLEDLKEGMERIKKFIQEYS